MATPFQKTLRSLQADRSRGPAALLLVSCALVSAWTLWLFASSVPVFVVSEEARLEVADRARPVVSPVDGRLALADVALGERVEAGQLLFGVQADVERLRVEEARAGYRALLGRLESLRRRLASRHQALKQAERASELGVEEARARLERAEVAAGLAREEARRAGRLRGEGLLSDSEYARLRAEAEERSAEVARASAELERRRSVGAREAGDRRAEMDEIRGEIEAADGERRAALERIDILREEVSRRSIRAPVSGWIGELAPVEVGSRVEAGDDLATVIPDGELRVVAAFAPAEALGRIRPGQRASVRLEGFPRTGRRGLEARVASVAGEVRDGAVRVELELAGEGIPLQHGLPGVVAVEVERPSPAALLLRSLTGRARTGRPARPGESAGG